MNKMMTPKTREPVTDPESLKKTLNRIREAQRAFAVFDQAQVDAVFRAAAIAADRARIPLARMAAEETGMGLVDSHCVGFAACKGQTGRAGTAPPLGQCGGVRMSKDGGRLTRAFSGGFQTFAAAKEPGSVRYPRLSSGT